MNTVDILIFLLPAAAVVADGTLGDPPGWFHPVRLIGAGLDRFEQAARWAGLPLRLAGALGVVGLAGLSGLAAWLLVDIPVLGGLAALYLAYAGLALGQLLREARRVESLIRQGDLAGARQALGLLVSRDTGGMNAAELRRTLAETTAENLSDGFFAPLFWLVITGPAGLWAYKAVSTADSMWGYTTPRFIDLGRCAARLDDLLAWLPARLCAGFLILAGWSSGLDWRAAYENVAAQARTMKSPNAGWPMAAAALLLGGRMGGPAVYFGERVDKPALGPEEGEWTPGRMDRLVRLCLRASVFFTLAMMLVSLIWLA